MNEFSNTLRSYEVPFCCQERLAELNPLHKEHIANGRSHARLMQLETHEARLDALKSAIWRARIATTGIDATFSLWAAYHNMNLEVLLWDIERHKAKGGE
jgi:Zn-finger domain-containing protein